MTKIEQFLNTFKQDLWLVGSRARGTHKQDSDIDLHIIDMYETDRTFDQISQYLQMHGILCHIDKWNVGCIVIPAQDGMPVSIDLGYWHGIPERNRKTITIFNVELTVA